VGFEPTVSAGERPQTYALDRAATGTGPLVPDRCDGGGGDGGDGNLTTMFDLRRICYMDVDGELMVNYGQKHMI
jgi:hypothetical protein